MVHLVPRNVKEQMCFQLQYLLAPWSKNLEMSISTLYNIQTYWAQPFQYLGQHSTLNLQLVARRKHQAELPGNY